VQVTAAVTPVAQAGSAGEGLPLPDRGLQWQLRLVVRASRVADPLAAPHGVALVLERGHYLTPALRHALQLGVPRGVAALTPADALALLAADREVTQLAPVTQVGLDRAWVAERLEGVATGDGANLCGGWLRARQLLDDAPWIVGQHAASTRRIVLCATGHIDTGITDPSTLVELARSAHHRGIGTSVLALGPDANHSLLQAMAAAGDGRCHPVATASEVAAALADEREQMGRRALRGVSVRLRPSEGVTLEEGTGESPAHGTPVDGRPLRRPVGAAGLAVTIGEVLSEEEVVLELVIRCPAAQAGRLRAAQAPLLVAHVEGERFTARGGTDFRTVVVPVHLPTGLPA
jgi:hypothetical protein